MQHLSHTTIEIVVIFDPPSCSSLYHFNFIYVGLGIWAPDRRCILDLGSKQSTVSSLSYALMFYANISAYEAHGPICLGGRILDMSIPY